LAPRAGGQRAARRARNRLSPKPWSLTPASPDAPLPPGDHLRVGKAAFLGIGRAGTTTGPWTWGTTKTRNWKNCWGHPHDDEPGHNPSHVRSRFVQETWSRGERTPIALMTNLFSTRWPVEDLMPQGTFSPAARQSSSSPSTFCNCEEIGTTQIPCKTAVANDDGGPHLAAGSNQ